MVSLFALLLENKSKFTKYSISSLQSVMQWTKFQWYSITSIFIVITFVQSFICLFIKKQLVIMV